MFFGTGSQGCRDCCHDANGRWSCTMNCSPKGEAPETIKVIQDGGTFMVLGAPDPADIAEGQTVGATPYTYPGQVQDWSMNAARTARHWFLENIAQGKTVEWM